MLAVFHRLAPRGTAELRNHLGRIAASPRILAPILVAFVFLGAISTFKVPLYQGSDEGWHYAYVEHYALGRPLPNLNLHFLSGDPSAPYWQTHEASQAPLYYILMGGLASLVPRGDLMQEQLLEGGAPNGMYGNFLPQDRGELGSGHVLAGHLVRLATVLMGATVIACGYFTTKMATGQAEIALLVAAFMAFNPRIIILSAQISNDMAVACVASLSLALATRFVIARETPRIAFSALLGVCAGISLLTKYSGGVIIVAVVSALLFRCVRHRLSARWLIGNGLAVGLGAMMVVGWFFARNWTLYSDILAWNKVNEMNAARAVPRRIEEIITQVPFILSSFFGHPAYPLAIATQYTDAMLKAMVPAGLGTAWLLWRRRLGIGFGPLLVALVLNLVAYYPWLRDHDATENMRFFSPTYVPITMLFVVGLLAFVPRRWWAGLALAAPVAYGAFTFATLTAGYQAMFAYPNYVDAAQTNQILARASESRVLFENGIEMIDARISASRIISGEPVDLTVVWRTTQPLTTNAHLTLDLRDEQDRTVTALNTENITRYSYVPRAWIVRGLVRETYTFRPTVQTNTVLRILAGWHAQDGLNTPILPVGHGGVSVEIGRVKVRAEAAQPAIGPVLARIPGLADLTSVSMDADTVSLSWRATAEPTGNFTIFAHGLGDNQVPIAQQDQPFSYAAAWWTVGEQFTEALAAPGLGRSRIVQLGVYDPVSQTRMPAFRPDGSRWVDDIILFVVPMSVTLP